MQYRFGLPHDLRIQCHGLGCHSNNNGQLYEISQSVNFIDISEAPIEKYSEFPVIEAKFPNDFFYPFVMREQPSGEVTSNASDDKQESITVTALLMCLYFNLWWGIQFEIMPSYLFVWSVIDCKFDVCIFPNVQTLLYPFCTYRPGTNQSVNKPNV